MVGLLVNCKRTYANTDFPGLLVLVPFPLQQDSVDLHLCRRTSNIHRQVWLSFLWGPCSFPLGLVAHKILFLSYKCLFPPGLWMFWNQVMLTFKFRFSQHSQYLSWIQRLESLMWSLEPLQQCEKFFGIIVLQFVGHLPWQVWDFILTCLCPPTILLFSFVLECGITVCLFVLIWWVPASSCQWLFNSKFRFWCSHRRLWVHVHLFLHLVINITLISESKERKRNKG